MLDTAVSLRFGERVIALADATLETAGLARCDGHHENAVLAATPCERARTDCSRGRLL
jgi:hypothetical protein